MDAFVLRDRSRGGRFSRLCPITEKGPPPPSSSPVKIRSVPFGSDRFIAPSLLSTVGTTNGSHQGGNASYPVSWNGAAGTRLESHTTVPGYSSNLTAEADLAQITFYIWTDVFFGDESLGRMYQLVAQLILGSALGTSDRGESLSPRADGC